MDEGNKRKNPGFPVPPSFRIGDNQHTNDLMSRLQSFLPQMKAANEAISSESKGQVDIELKKETDDEDDSDSDSCSEASGSGGKIKIIEGSQPSMGKEKEDENNEKGRSSEPIIQIQFALTDPNNPVMELLANGNDSEEHGSNDDNDDEDEDDDAEGPVKLRAVKSMLKSSSSTTKKAQPKISILEDKPSPKKSLITELS